MPLESLQPSAISSLARRANVKMNHTMLIMYFDKKHLLRSEKHEKIYLIYFKDSDSVTELRKLKSGVHTVIYFC